MSSLSTSAFTAIKSFLAAKSSLWMPVVCSNSFWATWFDESNATLILSLIWVSGSG